MVDERSVPSALQHAHLKTDVSLGHEVRHHATRCGQDLEKW